MLAWFRRIIVSLGIGGASYAIMLIFMVLSVVYDEQLEPVVTFAFDTGRWIIDVLDSWVAGNRWGQVAVNHLRERVNMTSRRALDPRHHHRHRIRWHSIKLVAWRDTHRIAAYCNCDCERTSHCHPCRRALHLQCTRAGNVCGASKICRLDLAGVVECA